MSACQEHDRHDAAAPSCDLKIGSLLEIHDIFTVTDRAWAPLGKGSDINISRGFLIWRRPGRRSGRPLADRLFTRRNETLIDLVPRGKGSRRRQKTRATQRRMGYWYWIPSVIYTASGNGLGRSEGVRGRGHGEMDRQYGAGRGLWGEWPGIMRERIMWFKGKGQRNVFVSYFVLSVGITGRMRALA